MQSVGSLCVVGLRTILLHLDDRQATGAIICVICHCGLLTIYLNILLNIRMNLIGCIGLEICQLTMFGTKLEVNNWNC